MKQKLVIANFKSNKTRLEMKQWIVKLVDSFSMIEKRKEDLKIVLALPFPFLAETELAIDNIKENENVSIGVQDLSQYPAGAYTGAVGTTNLEGFGITHAIIGHSERRYYFHESEDDVAAKARECLAAGITPIICVTKDEIRRQAATLSEDERSKCVVAFEPIEHIGTGESDSLEDILSAQKMVQEIFAPISCIYGGSVNSRTDKNILNNGNIDGFLVGSACLEFDGFISLLRNIGSEIKAF